jgi:hypothetical protein
LRKQDPRPLSPGLDRYWPGLAFPSDSIENTLNRGFTMPQRLPPMPTITLPKDSLPLFVEALPKGCHVFMPKNYGPDKNEWNPKAPSPLANLAKMVSKSKSASAIVLEIDPCHIQEVRCTVQDHASEWPEYTFPPRVSAGIEQAARLALDPPPPKPGHFYKGNDK